MGADGGINWVIVKDKDEFLRLIRPFGLLSRGSSPYDSYHAEYLEAHPLPPEALWGTYGTDHGDGPHGIDTLKDMLEDAQHEPDALDPIPCVGDMTFLEALEDMVTRPDHLWYYSLGEINRTMLYLAGGFRHRSDEAPRWPADPFKGYGPVRLDDEPVFKMKVREWAQAVLKTIDPKSFRSVETWT